MKGLLLPVVPSCAEGKYHRGEPIEIPKVMYVLEKYGDRLGDCVVTFEDDQELAKTIMRSSGKRLVPAILGDREGNIFHWQERNLKSDWIRWILDNADRFEGVMLGNIVVEVTNHFEKGTPTEKIIERLCETFPTLAGRMIMAPWHYDVARDMATDGFPIRQALMRACPWFQIYWGYELLKDPPTRMKEWLQPVQVYSGFNFSEGARDHNLRKSLDAGYSGCLFFIPCYGDPDWADQTMQAYFTDLEN